MREFTPGLDSAQIIAYLLQGKSAREIGRIMGYASSATAQKKIDRLVKHGYLIKHAGPDHPWITITLTGYALLEVLKQTGSATENPLTQSAKVEAPTEKGKYFRLHALQIKYWFRSPLPAENIHLIQFRDHPTRMRNLKNHSDLILEFKDFNVTVTTRALKFTDIEVRIPYEEVEDPEILLERARDLIAPEVEHIEMILQKHIPGLKLRRLANGVFDANVVRGEIALENDEIAMKVGEIQKNSNEKFRIYDRDDGKLSALVDFSTGDPEFETVHPRTFMEKMRIWKGFADDLLSGDFYERQRQFTENQMKLQETMKQLAESQNAVLSMQVKSEVIQANSFKQHDERIMQNQELIAVLTRNVFNAINELTSAVAQLSGYGGRK